MKYINQSQRSCTFIKNTYQTNRQISNDKQNIAESLFLLKDWNAKFYRRERKKAGDKSIAEIENLISWLFSKEYFVRISRLVD